MELSRRELLPADTNSETFKAAFKAWLFSPPPPPSQPPPPDFAAYRRTVAATCSRLPLRGIDIGASDPTGEQKHLELDQVYVSLDTTTQVELREKREARERADVPSLDRKESHPLSALEAAAQNRHCVLLGDPGSGKSTFLNHLALCLAQNGLEPEKNWLRHLPGWPREEGGLLPIPVVLRDFAKSAEGPAASSSACPLWDFIARRFHNPTLAAVEAPLRKALEGGDALTLLDGLDEIPNSEQRRFVRDAVLGFQQLHPRSRIIVTCRTLSYQEAAWQLPGFQVFNLAPFSTEKIDSFITSWHEDLVRLKALNAETASKLTGKLRQAIRRPDLQRLAPNPLLLTVMALVHTHKGELPEARAVLYEEAVEILLWRWEQLKADGDSHAPSIRQLLRKASRSDVDLKRKLWRLAFDAHRGARSSDSEATSDIGELELLRALAELPVPPDYGWAKDMIKALNLRAGLLLERKPEVYAFPHRTFQEYLAASHLAAQGTFAAHTVQLMSDGALWREVILLAVGKLVYLSGDTDKPLALVGELCPEHAENSELAWQQAWLAGEVLNEVTLPRVRESSLGRDLLERVRSRLAALIDAGMQTPVERAKAGIQLGKLVDPRAGVRIIETPPKRPGFVWCGGQGEVTQGEAHLWQEAFPAQAAFKLGEPAGRKDRTWGSFTQFDCTRITEPFFLSKYPVTVAQYQLFVEAGGYRDRRKIEEGGYWTEAGLNFLENGWEGEKGLITGPRDLEPVFRTPNHPRVGVSWFEARAYCAWLNGSEIRPELARDLGFPTDCGLEIRLPIEAEWELAARWNKEEGEADDRLYPWGDDSTEAGLTERCNWAGAKIGHTSAVGLFPKGNAECGAADLAGNVWEWCQTEWINRDDKDALKRYNSGVYDRDDGDNARVLRGASWINGDPDALVSSYRYYYGPGGRNRTVGFRVVLVGVSVR